jgi:hypothetical protein
MKRALIVVLIAMFVAAVSGINDSSLAFSPQAAPAPPESAAHQQKIASRVSAIGVNHVVRIERMDGSNANALIEDIMADSMTVLLLAGPDRQRETIPFAQIKKIDEVKGHMLRNVLIGVGVGFAVLVGTCAASLNSDVSPATGR